MPCGIIEIDWVIMHIPKAIECLRIGRVWNQRIRLDEVVKIRRIETRLIVHQSAHAGVQVALTGVTVVRLRDGAEVCPLTAEYPFGAQGEDNVVAILRCYPDWRSRVEWKYFTSPLSIGEVDKGLRMRGCLFLFINLQAV